MIEVCGFLWVMSFLFRRSRGHQQAPSQRVAIYDHRSPQNVRIIYKDVPTTLREGYSLVRVFFAGINPVDAKIFIGDKLPENIARDFRQK